MSALEIGANAFNVLSVWFASRNSVHTWWSGIVGCALYGLLFTEVRLYADVTLQGFFVASCVVGWWNWLRGGEARAAADGTVAELPITHVRPVTAVSFAAIAVVAAGGYGWLLHALTDAANPFVDSTVLSLSILAQLLMVARKVETWPVWFLVDCIAVPLYGSKGLWLTAAVYAFFLVLVVLGWLRWNRLLGRQTVAMPA
jgi:nicotinamide mononucleotide transporter